MANRFCYNCGAPLQETAKFCKSCGTPVLPAEAPAEEVAPVAAVPVEPEAPETEILAAPQEETPVEPAPIEPEAEPATEEPEPIPEEPAPMPEPEAVAEEPEPVYIPQEPAAAVAVKTAPKEIKGYRKRGAWRTVLAIPLCIFVFLFSLVTLLVWDANQLLQGDVLADVVTGTIEGIDLTEIKAADIVDGKMEIEDKDASIIEWAIAEISETSEGTIEVTKKDVQKFLKESTIYDFISKILNGYTDEFFKGGDEAGVSKKELKKLFEDNAELAEDIFDVKIGDEEIDYFLDSLDESGVLETLEPGGMKKALGGVYDAFQYAEYLIIGFIALAVLTLLFILLLFLTNRKNILRTCGDVGILWVILGVPMTAIALAGQFIAGLLPGKDIAGILVASLLDSFLISTLIPALVVLGAGVLLIVIWAVGKKILVKSANKQA